MAIGCGSGRAEGGCAEAMRRCTVAAGRRCGRKRPARKFVEGGRQACRGAGGGRVSRRAGRRRRRLIGLGVGRRRRVGRRWGGWGMGMGGGIAGLRRQTVALRRRAAAASTLSSRCGRVAYVGLLAAAGRVGGAVASSRSSSSSSCEREMDLRKYRPGGCI
ncbi:hypothetical protein B0H13DRAFT_1861680 [Mycena leptocephala]|nr:hypothetical protein B0H13DRAFT_1861680 [Mycena leptocephala]